MVYGYHLFLKEMPRCFRFREEDMNTLPSWIQIHGLPPDCWNFYVLSMIVSRVGTPVHMDMLIHKRKSVKFARVLVEMDIAKPKVHELEIELPVGDVTVKFEYEHEFKLSEHCRKPGHAKDSCFSLKQKFVDGKVSMIGASSRGRSRSVEWKKDSNRGKSITHASTHRASSSKSIGHKVVDDKDIAQDHVISEMQHCDTPFCNKEASVVNAGIEENTGIDKGKKLWKMNFPC